MRQDWDGFFIVLAQIGMVVAVLWLLVFGVARFTVFPMMANYHECGSIFLCKVQP